jgi:catechol 2,3-dioxygenase-like lactoylglutathione lyase family enzyme
MSHSNGAHAGAAVLARLVFRKRGGHRMVRLTEIDHVNIRTRDIPASARFYAELFELEARNAPGYPADFVQWMYNDKNRLFIHLRAYDTEPGSTGVVDHVAINCTDKAEFVRRLTAMGREFQTREVPEEGATVIYTQDPHGVMLECYFTD